MSFRASKTHLPRPLPLLGCKDRCKEMWHRLVLTVRLVYPLTLTVYLAVVILSVDHVDQITGSTVTVTLVKTITLAITE